MCITFFQYLPQILHTYHAKTVGAVSIPTMLIQVPGSYLMVYTLAVRPGVNASTWVSFLVSGTLQLVLCVLCVYYHRKGGYRRLEAGTTSSGFALAEEEDVGSFGGDGDAGLSRGTSRAGSVDDKERLLGGSGDEARSHDAMGNFLSVPSRPAALSTDTLTLMLSQSPPVGVAWRDTDESATTTVARTTPEQNCDA